MDVLDKVKKLLRLSQSSNPNEAALAAATAQRLMDEYHLHAAELALETAGPDADEEPIEDFQRRGAPLGPEDGRWAAWLAGIIARANSCRIYHDANRTIALVGRASDAETVRYLYAYLHGEVTRLSERDGRGLGRTWRNNYRLGVVETIKTKLEASRATFVEAAKATQTNPAALARVTQALARIEGRGTAVEAWIKTHLRLAPSSGSASYYDAQARAAGRVAGQRIVLRAQPKGALRAAR